MNPAPASAGRRRLFKYALAAGGLAALRFAPWQPLAALAQEAGDFIKGPPVKDHPLRQLSPHVWMIWSPDGFPTPENRGMMCNMTFVVGREGVMVLDSGGSLQIGEMALRQLARLTDKPVVGVVNSHYHGDHWLGNHAYREAYGAKLPIYAHPRTIEAIRGVQGSAWKSMMEKWTNQATVGTEIVPPNTPVEHGATLSLGDVTLGLHHYGTAHTPADICVEVVEDGLTYVGDVAMDRRIANMDDGSYVGTFKYYDELERNTRSRIWVPGHGEPGPDVLKHNRALFEGIYFNCEQAVKAGQGMEEAKAMVLKDPRVASRAAATKGFESNIGKYVSLAYLEAEANAF